MLNTRLRILLLLLLSAVSTFFVGPVASGQAAPNTSASWTPPIGIPVPPFGITQTHMMYVNQMYAYSTGSAAYKDAGNGPYTHYIDSQSPSCTNSSNNYGTAATPRCNMEDRKH